jgi:nitroreductase
VNSFSKVLNQHRSIRNFKSDPIEESVIQEVLQEAIAGASSSGNLNSFSLVLTRDEENKRKLFELHLSQPMILQAPLLITFCADWFRPRQWLKLRGARDNFNNFLGYHIAAVDAIIVAQNVCLGFEARGYGICYMGTTLYAMNEISELLELPDTCLPVTTIVVGVPNENPGKRDRLPMDAFVHNEKYHQHSPTELENIYTEREVKGWERYMSSPDLKEQIEAAGIESLAQFYTSDLKYSPKHFIEFSERIYAALAQKNFLP